MKKLPYILFLVLLVGILPTHEVHSQTDDALKINVGKAVLNKSQWGQPNRFENKELKSLTVQITINPISKKNTPLDFDDFTMFDDDNKLRIRPNEVAYYRADKKIYYKSKAVNQNYNKFRETPVEGYTNLEAKTYKPNLFGRMKKNAKPAVKALKNITIKGKQLTFYLDFPVHANFSYGKIHYNGKPIGFAAVSE